MINKEERKEAIEQWNNRTKVWTEKRGKAVTFLAVSVMILLSFSILIFVASKGITIFTKNNASLADFFFGTE